nr:hypothetical protein [Tanacetum cinerariifolium]
MRRVRKGFSRVDTPLFEGMLVLQQVNDDDVADVVANAAAEDENAAEPTPPTLLLHHHINKNLSLPHHRGYIQTGGIIAEINVDKDVTLEEFDAKKDAEVAEENADAQGRLEESQAQVYHIDLKHADKVLSMHDDEAEPAEIKEVIEVVTTAKLMTKVVTVAITTINAASSTARRRKGVVIRDHEETATPLIIVHSEPKSKDKGKVGFKIDFFKGMSYDDIRPIFKKHFNSIVGFLEKGEKELEEEANKAIKRKSESSKEKAAKKQKIDEEVEELKTHLQIISNDEDDVFTEATPLALKEKGKQEKDKIGSKPDKNGKRGKARKSQKQLQLREQEKLKKMQVEGPKMQTPTKFY